MLLIEVIKYLMQFLTEIPSLLPSPEANVILPQCNYSLLFSEQSGMPVPISSCFMCKTLKLEKSHNRKPT